MAPVPFPPPTDPGAASGLSWLWEWIWPAASAAFGAGTILASTRSTAADHARRIETLEKSVPDGVRTLGEKIDANHRDVMRMIMTLAARRDVET